MELTWLLVIIQGASAHKRFATLPLTVTPGTTYTVKIYLQATAGFIRTNYRNATSLAYGTYNTAVDLSSGYTTGGLVTQDVTIPAGCTSAEFILSVYSTDPLTSPSPAFVGILIDSVAIEAASITYTPLDIYDVQYVASGSDSPELNNYVELSGIVTGTWTGDGYWMQDADGQWNGIYIEDASNTPSVGDSITVQGKVTELFGLTTIQNVAGFTAEPTPVVPINPVAVSTAVMSAEGYESVLVREANVECTNEDAGFGNWTINTNPGTPADSILIADDLYGYTCPVLGDMYDITGIVHYSYSEYKILPRNINDINGGAGCGMTPIYDIQYTTAGNGDSPENGNVVTTSGIVTGIFQIGSGQYTFFIQDGDGAWNGIYVYENGNTSLMLGDSVVVTGEVQEFNSLTEIGFVSNITVASTGNLQPTAVTVTNSNITDEMYEGVVVLLENAICQSAPDAYGAWTASDGNGTIKVDDDLLSGPFAAVVGDGYDIEGIRHYAFGENLLLPRSSAHIVTVGYNGIEENQSVLMVYPNPAENSITVKAEPNARVAIYNAAGSIVAIGFSNEQINVSGLATGIYQVVVTSNEDIYRETLIIK
ncbi:MAG: T9SS type A sorting domain-containing protein [Crocinitomicaceae bacterium]